jgi:hypothetical protein
MKFHMVEINRRSQCTGCGQRAALAFDDETSSNRA